MITLPLKALSIALFATAATPAMAQTMSPAQCDQMMMVGTQAYGAAAVAACTPYFQSLADGAVARGTFAVVRPQAGVIVSTSDTGG